MSLRRTLLGLAPILIATVPGGNLPAASLADVRSVYLFPMANGLDQYLASRLSRSHVLRVVTDPKIADAVITDRLGQAFEEKLQQARPELKPPPAKKESDKDTSDPVMSPPVSAFRSGRGTVFIVDAKSQQVVWSVYQPQKRRSPADTERTAAKIVKEIEKELGPGAVPVVTSIPIAQPTAPPAPAPPPAAPAAPAAAKK